MGAAYLRSVSPRAGGAVCCISGNLLKDSSVTGTSPLAPLGEGKGGKSACEGRGKVWEGMGRGGEGRWEKGVQGGEGGKGR